MATIGELTLREVPVVEPQTALDEAIALMQDEPLHAVVLVGDEQFMGVFDADALQSNLIPSGIDKSTLAVGPYVHPRRAIGHSSMPINDALALMRRRNVDLLPIVDGNLYRGVVTRLDLEGR